MRAHHLIIADRGHLRIYVESRPAGQSIPSLELVKSVELPMDFSTLSAPESDSPAPGRVAKPEAPAPARFPDEAVSPEPRLLRQFAAHAGTEITRYFRFHPEATWDLATAAGFHQFVLDHVATAVRRRLRHTLSKDLTKVPLTHSRPPVPTAVIA